MGRPRIGEISQQEKNGYGELIMRDPSRFFARTIIEADEVVVQIQTLREKFVYFDDAYDALVWSLARDCDRVMREITKRDGQTFNLLAQRKNEVKGAPRLRALYIYDDETIEILSLDVVS